MIAIQILGMSLLITAVILFAMYCGWVVGKQLYQGVMND
jgi:hypothetical protein